MITKRLAAMLMTMVMVFAMCACGNRYSKDPKKNAQIVIARVEKKYPEYDEKPGRFCLMVHATMFNSADFRNIDTEVKMETAEEVAFVLGVGEIKKHKCLYEQRVEKFLQEAAEADADVVVAVGHNPFIEQAAEVLCGGSVPFKTGSISKSVFSAH